MENFLASLDHEEGIIVLEIDLKEIEHMRKICMGHSVLIEISLEIYCF